MWSMDDGTLAKMTTPLMDNTVPITTGTTHPPSPVTHRHDQLAAPGCHHAGV